MHETGPRGTAPHEQHHDSPVPGSRGRATDPVRIAAAAGGFTVLSSVLVMGGALATAGGVLAAVVGIVLGIVALVRSRRASARGVVTALAVLALVWGTLNAVGGGSRLLVWPATEVYQQCTSDALTLSSTQRCQKQLTDNVWHHFSGTPLETGFPTDGTSPTATTSAEASPAPESPSATASPAPASDAASASASGTPSATPSR